MQNYSGEFQTTIARFDPVQNSWTKLGNLNVARERHGVIQIDDKFIVIGGWTDDGGDVPTESCQLNEQTMKCATRKPQLSKFSLYPELILVPTIYYQT